MVPWPFSARKDHGTPMPSVDSGYGSMSLSEEISSTTNSNSRPSIPKRVAKRVAKEHLDRLKGFRLTFGGPLIAYVRARPILKGQHQALLIDMKWLGETEQDARLTIIISCYPAYEKVIKAFLREERLAIQSFFNPGGTSRAGDAATIQPDDIQILVMPMSPTALSQILCQRPSRCRPGLQLVGEKLSYQSAEGFQEATFGGFVGISYDVGRWAVFGLTTSHLADWELEARGTYSVLSHVCFLDQALEASQSKTSSYSYSIAKLRTILAKWKRFELQPVEGLQSGEYTSRRRGYVATARHMLGEIEMIMKKYGFHYKSEINGDVGKDSAEHFLNESVEAQIRKISDYLEAMDMTLGHGCVLSPCEKMSRNEQSWKLATRGSFGSVATEWLEVHNSPLSDDYTGAGDVVAQSTDMSSHGELANFDWALIRIPELDKEMSAAVASPGATRLEAADLDGDEAQSSDETKRSILLSAGHQFPAIDLPGETSFICIPPSRDFVETIELPTERLDSQLSKGDSGSWVMTEDGRVLGHLVATNCFGQAILIPMAAILRDIQSRLGVLRVSIPQEPIAMAFCDGSLPHLSRSRKGQNHIQEFLPKFQPPRIHSNFPCTKDDLALGAWRQDLKGRFREAEKQWLAITAACETLAKCYGDLKTRFSQEWLKGVVDYHQWAVQETYQLKAMEDQRREDKARWSEQKARWVYQDALWADPNQHWDEHWWTAYMEEWEADLKKWLEANDLLKRQAESLGRCKEMIMLQGRKHVEFLGNESAILAPRTHSISLSSGPPKCSPDQLQRWLESSSKNQPKFWTTSGSVANLGVSNRSTDSGYDSMSPLSTSSNSPLPGQLLRPRRNRTTSISKLPPVRWLQRPSTTEIGDNEGVFPHMED